MCPENNNDLGTKRPHLHIKIDNLHLDNLNPRLHESIQGKSENEVLKAMYLEFNLDELALSMSKNGYFDEEPLVVIPKDLPSEYKESPEFENFIKKEDTHFIVVEGNRRLSSAKILLDIDVRTGLGIRTWPDIDQSIEEDLKLLPAIVYKTREEIMPYLGVRHITGIRKWDSYPKARYLINMIDSDFSIEEIEEQIGDKQGSVRKNCIGYSILEQASEEFSFEYDQAKEDFSFLILSIGQGPIKRFLGLPSRLKDIPLRKPISTEKMSELRNLLSWIFGEGKEKFRVIKESRDITNYLKHVVESPEAVKYLEETRDLKEAYELSDGEENMLKKSIRSANRNLEKALGIAHRYKTQEIIKEIDKCLETIKRLIQSVRNNID